MSMTPASSHSRACMRRRRESALRPWHCLINGPVHPGFRSVPRRDAAKLQHLADDESFEITHVDAGHELEPEPARRCQTAEHGEPQIHFGIPSVRRPSSDSCSPV